MIIAQISDLHVRVEGSLVYDRFDTGICLARCVAHIERMRPRPDALLATGDLVDGGSPGEYRRLRELLAPLCMPVYLIPGNHDERGALREEFRDHAYLPPPGAPVRYVVEDYPVRLIGLDTVVPGSEGGALDWEQLDWLDRELAAQSSRPTLIFMHHPPLRTGIRGMDDIALSEASAARLGEIVARHRHIALITCGHVHRGIQARWQGTAVSVCPSSAFQGILNLRGDRYVIGGNEPPAYQVHYWNGSELVTHTVALTQ
jgi:3',5'-cyclic-AMP phosphodiesterase